MPVNRASRCLAEKGHASQYLGAHRSPPWFNIETYARKQHEQHCNYVLGDEFEHVHRAMDENGGWQHRRHGHSETFLRRTFKTKKERNAGRVHLIGDFLNDVAKMVIDRTFKKMIKRKIPAPSYKSSSSTSWNISKQAQDKLIDECSKAFVVALGAAK